MQQTRMLRELMPDETEVRGLHALLLVTDARRATRADDRGRLIRLEDQDRSRWDRAALAEAETLITGCLRAARPGRYVLQAAIAALYAEAPAYEQTDWSHSSRCTTNCCGCGRPRWWRSTAPSRWPWPPGPRSPSRRWNGLSGTAAWRATSTFRRSRRTCWPGSAARDEAAGAYRRALELTANEAERAFLAEPARGPPNQRARRRSKPYSF